jgi:hypothetical protein
MPTTLPDVAARERRQRRRLFAELVPIALAIFYLVLLAWSAVGLATDVGVLFAPTEPQANPTYSPMEPAGRTADAAGARILALAPRQ